MSWQDDAMAEQEAADALEYMGEAEWRDLYDLKRDEEKMKKEKLKEYNANYWKEHKEEISEARKRKYKKDRDKILTRNKKWLKDNKDHWNAYQREYRRRKKEGLDKSKSA